MRLNAGFAVLLGALAGPILAQAPTQNQPEIATHDEPVTFSSRVNLVSVSVVVRDRNNKAVGNLEKEDFQVFDKGELQAITKFSIEKSGAAVEAKPGESNAPPANTSAPNLAQPVLTNSFVAYLVDDVHLKAGDLLQTRKAMNRLLDEALEPRNSAAIFITSGQMLSDFTQDREQLHKAVESIQPWNRGMSPDDCPYVSYYLADMLMNKFLYFSGLTDVQIAGLVTDGTGDPSLIGVVKEAGQCSRLALNPPPPPHIPPYLPPEEPLIVAVRQAVRQSVVFGERETALILTALNDVIRKLSVTPGSRNLVLVSPGFLLTPDNRPNESDLLDRAIRANVTINAIDARGVFTAGAGIDASQRGFTTHEAATYLGQSEAAAATQAADILAEMADGTGGTFFHHDNDLTKGLKLLATRPEYVYVLGFSPEGLKFDGTYHALKVTLKNSANLTLKARRGYWVPRYAVDAAQAARQELQDTFFSQEEIPGIPLDLQTSFFKSGDEMFQLSVTARLGLTGLRFRKADDRNDDTLIIVAGLFDPTGKNVAATRKVMDLRLRNQSLAALQNSGIRLKESFSVAPGRYLVRVVVTDSEGQTITARNGSVQIP
jgi:VWFA-related protein